MSIEQQLNHPSLTLLQQLATVAQWEDIGNIAAGAQEKTSLDRILAFVSYATARIENSPANLVSLNVLNNLCGVLQQAFNELSNFRANGAVGHLNNARDAIDQGGYNWIAQIPSVDGADAVAVVASASGQLRLAENLVRDLAAKSAALMGRFNALQGELDSQRQKAGELTEELNNQKTAALHTNAEMKRDYATFEQEMRQRFITAVDDMSSDAAIQLKRHEDALKETKTQIGARLDALIAETEAQRDKAIEIVEIVGNTGLTGNYQKIANHEATSANRWRIVTVAIFLGTAAFGGFTLVEYGKNGLTVEAAILRMIFAALVASIALYTARESARHRSTADNARRVELELASLGPFLEALPREKQAELREKLTDKYFGRQAESHTVDPTLAPKDVLALAEKTFSSAVDLVKTLAKKT